MTEHGAAALPNGRDGRDRLDASDVLAQVKDEVVAGFGHAFPADAIRVDVDVFADDEPLVAGRHLDSMDLVQVIAVLEERFDLSLAASMTGDEPITLANVARRIAGTAETTP